ncbi:MAG: replicative DNA helicase [Chloroflexi bacterium]|nr:replicative DNA helicase [Chloroflexota bacterium]
MYPERLPPHDAAAEEAVLGSLLIDGEAVTRVAHLLKTDDFFREKNRWVYDACLALYERREPLNEVTVAHELVLKNRLDDVGGPAYLNYLVTAVPTSVYVEYYAQIVVRTALMRRLISAAGEIAALAYEGGPDADVVLDQAEDILFHLRRGHSIRDFVHIRQVIDAYLEQASATKTDADLEALPRIPTGYPALDALLGGLHRSDLVIVAARPGVGKTSLALGFAHHAATRQRARAAVFSLEMSKEQLVERLLAAESGVDSMRLRLGRQNPAEERRILDAAGKLSDAEIYIDDSPFMNVVELRSKARRLHTDRPLDLIVVDYLQLLQGSGYGDNRVAQMSEISRSLKALARELNVPLVALSQLSRAVETRSPHIPMLADLRESGSIEQDADVVMFIYREDMYYTEEEWNKRFPTQTYPKGIAKVIVAKHRNGPTGERALLFRESVAKFESLAFEWEETR